MDKQSWIPFKPQEYESQKLLGEDQLNIMIQNLTKCGVDQTQLQLSFKTHNNLKTFQQTYQQQIAQDQQFTYTSNHQQNKQTNKFTRCYDINTETQYDVKQLIFPSCQFLNIFMKIYEARLTQIQIQYHYRLRVKGNFLKVFFTKNQKISSFFKNQIFQMKTKLNLYYSHNPIVIQKVKFSDNFNKLASKLCIAAEYHRLQNRGQVAILFSNIHQPQQIIQIINKNFLEHMTIINLLDRKLSKKVNQRIFHLISSSLSQVKKSLEKANQIAIEQNMDKCLILIHDRHQCFRDTRNQIQLAISNMIFFKLDGEKVRTYYNKIIRNHASYAFLRVKCSKRGLYCVLNYQIFQRSNKHAKAFKQLFQEYFQNLEQNTKITFYLKNLKYPKFKQYVQQLIQQKNITIQNYQHMIEDVNNCPKLVLRTKGYNDFQIDRTIKQYFQIFLSIIFKKTVVGTQLNRGQGQDVRIINNSEKNSKKSTCSQASQMQKSQSQIYESKSAVIGALISEPSQESLMDLGQLRRKSSQKCRKSKYIQLQHPYQTPTLDEQLSKFWDCQKRQQKLERAIVQRYPDPFSKHSFKTFKIIMKNKFQVPNLQQIQTNKIYLSTSIEKNNQINHHFIDLNQFKKIHKQTKDKFFFIFYKVVGQQKYYPSYALKV